MAKRKSPIKEMINESLKELRSGEFPTDPTLDEAEETGPVRFAKGQKAKDEIVIDELFSNIAGKEGYFIKLKKEVRPNEWMIMKIIENDWRQWADVEAAVYDVVRENTKRWPQKWGSGFYRVEIACRGGMRGAKYPIHDVHINADEELVNPAVGMQPIDVNASVASKIEELSTLVSLVGDLVPKPQDPATIQSQIANAYQKGMEIKAGEGSSSNAMMVTMMTGLMGMMTAMAANKPLPVENKSDGTETITKMLEVLKSFGVIGNQTPEKQKTTIDFITELKALGMDLFKKDDPIAQIGQLKQLASIAGEFMGMGSSGDRPGIMEKIVDALGPVLPGIVKDVKETMGNAVQAQIEVGKNIERAKITGPTNTNRIMSSPPQGSTSPMNSPTEVNPQVTAFFNGLHEAVKTNNRMFYPVIYSSLLQDAQGQALINGIVLGTHTAKDVIELLQVHGDARFKESEFVMKHLVSYTNGFIMWLRQMAKPSDSEQMYAQPNGSKPTHGTEIKEGEGYDVGCPVCEAVYAYASEADFQAEASKECGAVINGVNCPGTLKPLTKV